MATSMKIVCPNHGAVVVTAQTKLGAVTHRMLECGCTVEEVDDFYVVPGDAVLYKDELWRVSDSEDGMVSLSNVNGDAIVPLDLVVYIAKDTLSGVKKSEVKVSVGAVVRHTISKLTGTVERRGTTQDGDSWIVRVVENAVDKKFSWRDAELEVLRPGYNFKEDKTDDLPWYRQTSPPRRARRDYTSDVPPPKKKPKKSHSITTADLIKEEVNDLRKADTAPTPPVRAESKDKRVDLDDVEKVKTKKRKGTW